MATKVLLLIAGLVCMTGSTPPFGARAPGIPGGWFWYLNSPDYVPEFEWWVESAISPDTSIRVVVLGAWKQIVFGTNYRYMMLFKKMSPFGVPIPFRVCDVIMHITLFGDNRSIIYLNCQDFGPGFGMGGPMSAGKLGKKKI